MGGGGGGGCGGGGHNLKQLTCFSMFEWKRSENAMTEFELLYNPAFLAYAERRLKVPVITYHLLQVEF